MPFWVLTTLPAGIVFDDVKSLFRKRTTPWAFCCSTRLPVAGNVFVAVASTDITWAGIDLGVRIGGRRGRVGDDRHGQRSDRLVLGRHDDRRRRQHAGRRRPRRSARRARWHPDRPATGSSRCGDRSPAPPVPPRTGTSWTLASRGEVPRGTSRIDVPAGRGGGPRRRRGGWPRSRRGRGPDRGRGGRQLGCLHVVEGLLDGPARGRFVRPRGDRDPRGLTGQGSRGRRRDVGRRREVGAPAHRPWARRPEPGVPATPRTPPPS